MFRHLQPYTCILHEVNAFGNAQCVGHNPYAFFHSLMRIRTGSTTDKRTSSITSMLFLAMLPSAAFSRIKSVASLSLRKHERQIEQKSRFEDDGAENNQPALGQNLLNNVLEKKRSENHDKNTKSQGDIRMRNAYTLFSKTRS